MPLGFSFGRGVKCESETAMDAAPDKQTRKSSNKKPTTIPERFYFSLSRAVSEVRSLNSSF